MMQYKLTLMPHMLHTSANETISEETGGLSLTMSLPGLLSQRKRYETFYGTQTGRDELLFTSMIDLLWL